MMEPISLPLAPLEKSKEWSRLYPTLGCASISFTSPMFLQKPATSQQQQQHQHKSEREGSKSRSEGPEPVGEEDVGVVLSLDSHGNGNIEADMGGSTRLFCARVFA